MPTSRAAMAVPRADSLTVAVTDIRFRCERYGSRNFPRPLSFPPRKGSNTSRLAHGTLMACERRPATLPR